MVTNHLIPATLPRALRPLLVRAAKATAPAHRAIQGLCRPDDLGSREPLKDQLRDPLQLGDVDLHSPVVPQQHHNPPANVLAQVRLAGKQSSGKSQWCAARCTPPIKPSLSPSSPPKLARTLIILTLYSPTVAFTLPGMDLSKHGGSAYEFPGGGGLEGRNSASLDASRGKANLLARLCRFWSGAPQSPMPARPQT